jgi:GNAT superfamily N-acetyltransferase
VGRRLQDVTLDNLRIAPEEVLQTIYWESAEDDPSLDARFQKEEWFSSTLLEWGPCGKLLVEDETCVGFAEYAPPSLFARLPTFPAGRASSDAIYLAYCFVTASRRDRGVGSELIRAIARDLVDRGFRAVEALGEHAWTGGWILPGSFLEANGFSVIRDDPATALWRLDLLEARTPARTAAAAELPLPEGA